VVRPDTLDPLLRALVRSLLLILVAACGGGEPSNDTVALCEQQCTGAVCEDTNCLDKCEAEYEDAARYGCVEEYENILDCAAALPDVCAIEECSLETSAFSVCFGFYCGEERAKDDPDCTPPE
jgi:hypothetical protein